jgi:hypothetical protein
VAKNVSGAREHIDGARSMNEAHAATRLHIFFHPDCDRRLWHRTRSADPDRHETDRALAGSRLAPPTAGGEFRPALKTCAGTMPAPPS